MKKLVMPALGLALLLFACFTAFAQEEGRMQSGRSPGGLVPVGIGIGPELNRNTRGDFTGGAVFSFDCGFAGSFAAGLNFTASNFDEVIVLEPAAMLRKYFSSFYKDADYSGLFVQMDAGTSLLFEDGEMTPMFLGGMRGGIRLPFEKMYIELYGRVGYPFMVGVGILAGVRFN